MIQLTDREADQIIDGYLGGPESLPLAIKKVIAGRELDILRALQISLRDEGADRYARKTMIAIGDLMNDALDHFKEVKYV